MERYLNVSSNKNLCESFDINITDRRGILVVNENNDLLGYMLVRDIGSYTYIDNLFLEDINNINLFEKLLDMSVERYYAEKFTINKTFLKDLDDEKHTKIKEILNRKGWWTQENNCFDIRATYTYNPRNHIYLEFDNILEDIKDDTFFLNEEVNLNDKSKKHIIRRVKKETTKEGFYNKENLWNAVEKINDKPYRQRVECMIYNDFKQVLLYVKKKGKYSYSIDLAGGGTNKEDTFEESLIREVREEVRREIDHIYFFNEFSGEYKNKTKEYYGYKTYLYIAQEVGYYTGFINTVDKEDEMRMFSKYYDLSEAYKLIKESDNKPEQKSAYLKALNFISNNAITEKYPESSNEVNVVREDFDYNKKLPYKLLTTEQRKQLEEIPINIMNYLDKTGANAKKYADLFKGMSNEQFSKWMHNFLNSDEELYLEIMPNKNEPNLRDIKKCADYLKIPLDEFIYYRHDGDKDNPVRSNYVVPVGWLDLKRMQHTRHKKNNFSLKSEKRNSKTGNLTGHDKVARITDAEVYQLKALGANYALQEFMSPRADNMEKKIEMNKQISSYGYVYLKDLPNNTKGQSLVTGYVYLLSAGLDSDLLK